MPYYKYETKYRIEESHKQSGFFFIVQELFCNDELESNKKYGAFHIESLKKISEAIKVCLKENNLNRRNLLEI